MYRDFIKRKFPANESEGLYVTPNLGGSKLGRILNKETQIQTGDVVAFYLDSGFFGSTYFILTNDHGYYPGGQFPLENVRSAEPDGKTLIVFVGTLTGATKTHIKLGDEDAATAIAKVLDDLAFYDPEKTAELAEADENKYAEFEGQAIDWLKLRDEIMLTIDMLHEKFQDGKLSLLEYEGKKAELLERL